MVYSSVLVKNWSKHAMSYEELYDLYITKNLSANKIGLLHNKTAKTIIYYLNKYKIPIRTRQNSKFNCQDLTGKVYGKLTVETSTIINQRLMWNCLCECGAKVISRASILNAKQKTSCKKCKYYGWKGYGEISGTYWQNTKRRAEQRNKTFNITIEYAWNLFVEQDKKCSLTKLPLHFQRDFSRDSTQQTASLDRIDNSIGYEEGNIQWVHKIVNMMKQDYSLSEVYKVSELIYLNNLDKISQLKEFSL